MNEAGNADDMKAPDTNGNYHGCLQTCPSQDISVDQTSASFPHEAMFPFMDKFCFILAKLEKICNDSIRRKAFQEVYGSCQIIEDSLNQKNICLNNQPFCHSQEVESNQALVEMAFKYAQENAIVLNVFFRRPFYTELKRDIQITRNSYIGNVGGLMGLCLGLSLISIFEILYHLCLALKNMILT